MFIQQKNIDDWISHFNVIMFIATYMVIQCWAKVGTVMLFFRAEMRAGIVSSVLSKFNNMWGIPFQCIA